MGTYLKLFETTAAYEAAESSLILPNVSVCLDQPTVVHYNPSTPIETRVVCKYNVEDTEHEISVCYGTNYFSAMEIDGVEQSEVFFEYTFDTLGEHTIKYTLADPTTIDESAFQECDSITSIVIPDSVTSIGGGAFYYCNSLVSVNIPSGVTSIGYYTFGSCYSLTSITIPNGVTSISSNAFNSCSSLTSINIPSSVTSIGSYAFCGCSSLDAASVAAIKAINPTDDMFYCEG